MSNIEWTEKTWNPLAGCSVVSPGCKNCYAMKDAHRLAGNPNPKVSGKYKGLTTTVKGKPVWTGKVRLWEDHLTLPLRWKKPRRIFVNSMSDLFHEDVPDNWIDKIFAVMALCPQHTFQVLTKRPERMRRYFEAAHNHDLNGLGSRWCEATWALIGSATGESPKFPLFNVWLGTSVEDQARADERIPHLLATPAAVRFLSVEPLLGPVDLDAFLWRRMALDEIPGHALNDGATEGRARRENGLDWIIVGGESGPGARPMHTDWARSIRDQCEAAGVPFFFKQWGAWAPEWAWARSVRVNPVTGDTENPNARMGPRGLAVQGPNSMFRVGKKAAGRTLDGRTWDEYPA